MNNISSRERVKKALSHRIPDQLPLDIGGSNVTTIVDSAYERLKSYLGIQTETIYMNKRARQIVLDEAIAQILRTDTRPVFLGKPDSRPDLYRADGSIEDEWRVIWKSAGGHYNPVVGPLENATISDLDSFSWPDPNDPGRTRGLKDWASRLHAESEYCIILSLPVAVVHLSQYLRGYEQFLVDLIDDPGFSVKLMDHVMDVYLQMVSNVMEAAGPYVDVVTFGDDVAFQDRLMVRPSMYRKFIKPHHQQIIQLIKSKSSAAVLYHCCGTVIALIPDFIEIGVDALNPVQVSAKGMDDTSLLKHEFGADICFWGGIDTQHILPSGKPEDVRKEVGRRAADLAEEGGYVVAAVHDIQEDVPPQNIIAMAEAAREFKV
jgi:uroporphyrinogen decarboxylase